MNREQYDDYVAKFNARDYDGVFDFYIENPVIAFFGVELRSRQALKDFYGFLHTYVKETIQVTQFASTGEFVALEAIVRIECQQDLTQDILDAQGYGRLFPIAKGEVQEIPQFIHYYLKDGKITRVGCAIPL